MLRIRVIWVGKTDRGFYADAAAHYLQRMGALAQVECVEIRGAGHSGRDPAQAAAAESAALLKRIGPQERVMLLDEKGKELDSPQFAAWLGDGASAAFVLGGAYGVDASVRKRADAQLSLSRLTLPHQLARVVLLEQIYRGLTILQGHGYHHG